MKPNKGATKAKRAFTLPMVMLILFIATGLISALMVIYENYRGRSTSTLTQQAEYNILQDAVERGRALIRSDDYPEVTPSSKDITQASDLMIRDFDYSVTIADKTVHVFVEIYDSKMEGNSSRLNTIKNDPVERLKMPTLLIPQMSDMQDAGGSDGDVTNSGNIPPITAAVGVGVYTIRARVEPSSRNRSLEMLTTMEKAEP